MTQVRVLVTKMKEYNKRVDLAVLGGALVHDIEVTENSFVQFVKFSSGGWEYNQCKFKQLPPNEQEMFLGAYINETVHGFKIIGIYDWLVPQTL